jgi:hypothetical protein
MAEKGLTLSDRVCEHLFLVCVKSIKRNVVSDKMGGVVFERKCPNQSTFLSTTHYYSSIRQELVRSACNHECTVSVYMRASSESSSDALSDKVARRRISAHLPLPKVEKKPSDETAKIK